MSRPFDEAKYKALLEGLEISVVSLSQVLSSDATFRIDSAFFSSVQLQIREKALQWEPFGDYCSRVNCGPFGSTILDTNYQDSGMPMLRPFNLRNMRSDANEIVNLSPDFVRNSGLKVFHRADIAFARVGDVGCSLVAQNEVTISPNIIAVSIHRDRLNPYYAAFFFNTKYGRLQMEGAVKAVAQPTISTELIRTLRIPVFSDAFQARIQTFFEIAENAHKQAREKMILSEESLLTALGLEDWQPPSPLAYTQSCKDVFEASRLDSEYFYPKYTALHEKLAAGFQLMVLHEIGKVLKGSSVFYSEDGIIPIIRSGDLSDISDDAKFLWSSDVADIFRLQKGDVLISSIGFGSIGKVQVFDRDGDYGTVSEVTVVRQKIFNPYYLAAYMRSIAGQMQIERYITGATGQLHLYPKDVGKIFVPMISLSQQQCFETLSKDAGKSKLSARASLSLAVSAVETAIEQGEDAAMSLLEREFVKQD